jgi:3-oxoacyl-[acyl-carrier protein] reductase
MDLGIAGKVALVAGASRGLGRAVARGLALEGAKVALCARDEEVLQETARSIAEETGAEIWWRPTDVSDLEESKAFVRGALERFGAIHILVNNAGGPPSAPFMDLEDAHWEAAFRVNLMSAVRLSREAIPHMRSQRWGRIVNMTSAAVKQPIEGLILSNSLRAGVHGWAKTLSNELAPENILVNSVCTGFMLTDRLQDLVRSHAGKRGVEEKEIVREWERNIPMGRLGSPEEFADLVLFLASERASYITGASIPIDGGYCKGLL